MEASKTQLSMTWVDCSLGNKNEKNKPEFITKDLCLTAAVKVIQKNILILWMTGKATALKGFFALNPSLIFPFKCLE